MQKRLLANSLSDLVRIRQNGTYSSTNTIRGSMVNEMYIIFSEYLINNDKKYLMDRVMVDNIIHKNSYYNRENVWRIFDQRYLSCPPWIVEELAKTTRNGVNSQEFLSLAYLYFAFRERMIHDFVIDSVWENWKNKRTALDTGDVQAYVVLKGKSVPAIEQWSETTIQKCAQSILTSLRNFGVLKGSMNKSIQRPSISLEAAYHLLCILMAEGYDGRALITAKDWRLFLWDEIDVIDALNRMTMRQWIRFEKSGPTTIIKLVRLPGEKL